MWNLIKIFGIKCCHRTTTLVTMISVVLTLNLNSTKLVHIIQIWHVSYDSQKISFYNMFAFFEFFFSYVNESVTYLHAMLSVLSKICSLTSWHFEICQNLSYG